MSSAPLLFETHALQSGAVHRALEAATISLPNLRHVVTVSGTLRQDLLRRYHGLSPERVVTLHDAACIPANQPPPSIPPMRDVLQVGYVGSLYHGKGAQFVARLANQLPEYDFHIVGGSEADTRALRNECGRTANLRIHGYRPHSDLPAVYASLDIGLVPPSRTVLDRDGNDIGRWTSPLKLFELMAHGVPVIASDLPNIREVVNDRQQCLLAPPDVPTAWADRIRTLASNPRLRRTLGMAGRELVMTTYTWNSRAHQIAALLATT